MATLLQLLGSELEIHLGLAGTGDSPEQQTTPRGKLLVGIDHGLLLSGQGLGTLLRWSNRGTLLISPPPLPQQIALLDKRGQQLGTKATGHQVPLPSATTVGFQPSQKLLLARGGLVRVIRGNTALDPPQLTPPR